MRRISVVTSLALALTLGVAGVAAAQAPDRPDGGMRRGPGRGMEQMLLQGITLTADQQAKVDALRDAERPQGERARGGEMEGPPREGGDTTGMGARRARMEQRRTERLSALRAILTADQQVQFDKNVAEMQTRTRERRP